jgi:uncharacterized protein YcnI
LTRGALAGAVVVLAWPALAAAHVTVSPARTRPGERTLVFAVPNERFDAQRPFRIGGVTITAPPGVRISQVQAKPGWKTSLRGGTASWAGGSIEYGRYETFGINVDVPGATGELRFQAVERFTTPSGVADRFPVVVAVTGDSGSSSTHGLAVTALIVAVSAAFLALVGFFLALARWLRGV